MSNLAHKETWLPVELMTNKTNQFNQGDRAIWCNKSWATVIKPVFNHEYEGNSYLIKIDLFDPPLDEIIVPETDLNIPFQQ